MRIITRSSISEAITIHFGHVGCNTEDMSVNVKTTESRNFKTNDLADLGSPHVTGCGSCNTASLRLAASVPIEESANTLQLTKEGQKLTCTTWSSRCFQLDIRYPRFAGNPSRCGRCHGPFLSTTSHTTGTNPTDSSRHQIRS